jgi:tRNA pseudouridine-54 N-methylase
MIAECQFWYQVIGAFILGVLSGFTIGFFLGKHFLRKELRRLKTMATPVSVGKRLYIASQTVVIVNNEIDRREDSGKL